jgi:hypothetical protein
LKYIENVALDVGPDFVIAWFITTRKCHTMESFPWLKQSIISSYYDVGLEQDTSLSLIDVMPWAKHLIPIIYLMGAGASHLHI